jgi:S-disulfanyl-L-cysteine oxidoreductase SoxD
MQRKRYVVYFVFLFLNPAAALAQQPIPESTVLDAVYSDQQAARGQAYYTANCSACHGARLEGVSAPELTGERFVDRWREGPLDGIYGFITQRMPPRRDTSTSTIPDKNYLDILTYVLKVNGYPAGTRDLNTDSLAKIMFTGKSGPQPVPDGSLVVTVGCLSRLRDDVWILSKAAEPRRTRRSTTSPPEELQVSSRRALGALTFRLADLEAVSDFNPESHEGHKMQAKGFLVRQPNAERISLSAMEMLDSVCVP